MIKEIKFLTKDKRFPILIDEEGISVSRLSKFYQNNFSQKLFGDIYNFDQDTSINLYKNYINSLSKIFREIGVNINTVPVLDVLRKKPTKL